MAVPSEPSPSAPEAPSSSPPPSTDQQLGGRSPRTIRIVAAVVAVVIVLAGVVAYYVVTRTPTPPPPGGGTTCTLNSYNPLVFDQPEAPDSLDPAVTFSTPGWGAVQQVYQTLVMYNGSQYQAYLPVLAHDYSFSQDRLNITFHLRTGMHFSNGHPLNAYTMWFSLYRTILMNQPPEFILGENFFLPGLSNLTARPNQVAAVKATLAGYLNTGNFSSPSPTLLTYMEAAAQSFQVVDNLTLVVHLGWGYLGTGYTYILATLAAPVAAAVDPFYVQANGGVTAGAANTYLVSHMIGSGPFVMASYDPNGGMTLSPDPNYWGSASAAAEPWNNILQPANSSVQLNYQGTTQTEVADLQTGHAAGASFAYVGPSTINSLQGQKCITVKELNTTYSSTAGGWWIYMNQNTPPFNNLSVRQAVIHAINYDEIVRVAFGGYATRWVGPVPPGYPYYNPNSVPLYPYNLTLAKQEMNNSPYQLPGGFSGTLNYEYINLGDWGTVATLLQSDLAKIGIHINPVGIPLDTLYALQVPDASGTCASQAVPNQYGGPFPIGQEFYTSDYIAPDDWTQNNAISYGSANMCMSAYNNATMDSLVLAAASESNPTTLRSDYAQMTQLMYANYTNAWLVVPSQFQVYSPALHGIVSNPMGSALPFCMMFNTEYAMATTVP